MEKDYRYSLIPTTLLYILILIDLIVLFLFKNATGNRFVYFQMGGILFFSLILVINLLIMFFKLINFKKFQVGFISSFIVEEKNCIIEIGYQEKGKIKRIQTYKQPYILYPFLPKIIMKRDKMIGIRVLFFMNKKKNKCFIRHIYRRMY